ncbi:hypothetical protein MRB53_038437 [Persea americana]|nr:hypothetical protein MRB53_038437 [Persea americana]
MSKRFVAIVGLCNAVQASAGRQLRTGATLRHDQKIARAVMNRVTDSALLAPSLHAAVCDKLTRANWSVLKKMTPTIIVMAICGIGFLVGPSFCLRIEMSQFLSEAPPGRRQTPAYRHNRVIKSNHASLLILDSSRLGYRVHLLNLPYTPAHRRHSTRRLPLKERFYQASPLPPPASREAVGSRASSSAFELNNPVLPSSVRVFHAHPSESTQSTSFAPLVACQLLDQHISTPSKWRQRLYLLFFSHSSIHLVYRSTTLCCRQVLEHCILVKKATEALRLSITITALREFREDPTDVPSLYQSTLIVSRPREARTQLPKSSPGSGICVWLFR